MLGLETVTDGENGEELEGEGTVVLLIGPAEELPAVVALAVVVGEGGST